MSRLNPLNHMRRQRRLAAAYHAVFGTTEGAIVLRDLLSLGGMLETSHTPGDTAHTAFQEGRRSLALEIVNRLRWTETELHTLAAERTTDRLNTLQEDHDV